MDRGYKGRRPVPRPASWGRAREEWKRLLREWKPSWNFRYSRVLAGNRKSFSVAALFKINGDVLNRFLIPTGRRQPLWWTLRHPVRPLSYHGVHRMFERVN